MLHIASMTLVAIGLLFVSLGTVGLLRFPDVFSRLHALTKADNLGLGFVVVGLILSAASWWVVIQLLFIWLLVLSAATTTCHLIARGALDRIEGGPNDGI